MVILLLACASDSESPGLDPVSLAIRISLDTRGIRPSEAEMAAVEADPTQLDAFIDTWIEDERFGDRVEDLFDEVFLTRGEGYTAEPSLFGAEDDANAFKASVGGEIPRFVARLALEDRPWTDAVLADWTMADEVIGPIWPTDYPAGETGWKKVRYTDGRPAAGILAMNSLYWRYDSTLSNANRKRANVVSRIFLCTDFLAWDIPFDTSLRITDEDSLASAILTAPGCVACHAAVDPLASYFYGFFYEGADNPADSVWYHPEREHYWETYTGVPPSYFGVPSTGLESLARATAEDPRFPGCAVEHIYRGLLRREVDSRDTDALVAHREAFIAGGATLRSAWRSVLDDPRYRGEVPEKDGGVPAKLATPRLLGSQVGALTGFRWEVDGIDVFMSDDVGVRSLAGGIDGFEKSRRVTSPNPTLVLVQERLAEGAGAWAVDHGAPLVEGIDLDRAPSTQPETLPRLYWRVLGRRVAEDGEEAAALATLWEDLYALDGDPRAAWAGVVTALLREPGLVLY